MAERIAAALDGAGDKEGSAGLDRLLSERGADIVSFADWQKIEAAEAARARAGSPREKFTSIDEMLGVIGG